jgi:beta-galactosidase
LNGNKVLLKGGCIHHDNGPLGAAVYARAEERKIQLLKKNGYNAIRTSHNPPSPELLEACDRLGMLVIDEAFDIWEQGKNPEDYHLYFKNWWQKDLDALVLRDRNHPSVILWSIGNEIPERVDSVGLITSKKLTDRVHMLDPTRLVTEAICAFWDHPTYQWKQTVPAFSILDVGGYNYQFTEYEKDHQKSPDRIMIGTESFPIQALENWDLVEKQPFVIGDFVWTAFDYLGEAAIGHSVTTAEKVNAFDLFLGWPWFNAWCGDLDLIGNKKAQSYYRDIVWRQSQIAMAVHKPIPDGMKEVVDFWGWPEELQSWTWPGSEGKQLQVRVFSRAPMVRLKLNGATIAEQKIESGKIIANFNIAYQSGTLTAVNLIDGKETDKIEFKTTGTAEKIQLSADRTSLSTKKSDISYVMVEIADHNNQVVPNTEKSIQFSITGEGEIVAVGSANPKDMASFQKPVRKTWDGRCLVIVRSKGKAGNFILTAKSEGLKTAQIQIQAK